MGNVSIFFMSVLMACAGPAAAGAFETDTIHTSAGDLEITFIGHGSLMLAFGDTVIQVDPYSKLADYSVFPKAAIILLTHQHPDHLDKAALVPVRGEATEVVLTGICAGEVTGGTVMKNGETRIVAGIPVEAVPAYNLVHTRESGEPYHPRGDGNGYILTFGDTRLYIAGDTENTPEMKALRGIDVAFLPMNLPYTMTPEMVADAARAFRPKILYPYHFGDSDTSRLVELLRDDPGIEIRIRNMK